MNITATIQRGEVVSSCGWARTRLLRGDLLGQVMDALNAGANLLFPPTIPGAPCADTSRLLSERVLAELPLFAAARHWTKARIVAVAWADDAAVVTTIPPDALPPPAWWIAQAYAQTHT